MKLSIIIPLYNNEDTLERTVESVLRQNIDDFEIIIVDDGSTDNSGAVADDLARKNNRITAIRQEKKGDCSW